VADEHPNAWTISNRRFVRQIQWLRRHYTIVPLEEVQRCIASGQNSRRLMAITFDDGYSDNGAFALPYLIRHRIPFTYFVCVHQTLSGEPFEHDVAAGQAHRVNTVEDIRALAQGGVEIGLHTRTHADLGQVQDSSQLHDEVVVAGRELAQMIQRPVRYFAFPFGLHANMSAEAFQMAKEAGYKGVCSAYNAYNLPGEDPFHILRVHADAEWSRWKNCLTIDPRKLKAQSRFDYHTAPRSVSPEVVEEVEQQELVAAK
jgi:peptidoglycan/xylan/chitin deacetylase (PgdA/CDA1 family)